jgi:hypothetical protein
MIVERLDFWSAELKRVLLFAFFVQAPNDPNAFTADTRCRSSTAQHIRLNATPIEVWSVLVQARPAGRRHVLAPG